MKVENILENKSLYKQLVEVSNAGSIVDSGEPESGYVKPGVARRLGRIRGSQNSDEWFTRGGWTQLEFPKGDNPFGDDTQIRERQDIIFNPDLPQEPIESDDFITSGVGTKGQDFVQQSVDLHGKQTKTLNENLILERIDFLHVAQGIITLHKLNSKVRFLKKKGKVKADYVVETDTITLEPTSDLKDFIMTVLHEIHHAQMAKKYGKKKFLKMYNQAGTMAAHHGFDPHDDNKWEEKAENFAKRNFKTWYSKFKKA